MIYLLRYNLSKVQDINTQYKYNVQKLMTNQPEFTETSFPPKLLYPKSLYIAQT